MARPIWKAPRRGEPVILILALALLLLLGLYWHRDQVAGHFGVPEWLQPGPSCQVPLRISTADQNDNGRPDALDYVNGARAEVKRGTRYDGGYYSQGYPPPGVGACTDVVWRAFKEAGYDLKNLVDEDIRLHPDRYGSTGQDPDPNIDFRRVKNLQVFFQYHGQSLTTRLIAEDVDNLVQWQPGDIVVFAPPKEHIGIISDHRLRNGIPLVIHNAGPRASEADVLSYWPTPILYHFRFP